MPKDVLPAYESLLELAKSLREVKVQIESLKAMMFEHRPPFAQEFARHAALVAKSKTLKSIDDQIARIEKDLAKVRLRA